MATVVTGGAGFIGSNLVKTLLGSGRAVVVASDFSRLGFENLHSLGIRKKDVEIRNTDLTHYSQALKAVMGAESVFHLAARVGSLQYLHGTETAELIALQENLAVDANVFRACVEQGVKKLVYASSVAVYSMGSQSGHGAVFKETDLDLSRNMITAFTPDGGYGWSKLMGEIQLEWTKSLKIGIARIFNIFGVNEPTQEGKAHVIGDIIRKVILMPEGGTLTIFGDGNQTRDFLYVTDCVEGLLQLEKMASNPPIIANIGAGRDVTVNHIAETVIKVSGKNIKTAHDLSKPIGPVSRTADISRAKLLLQWQPQVSFNEGIRLTYTWLQNKIAKTG
jgi:nucleoside-diphosphate-sugar epimerase